VFYPVRSTNSNLLCTVDHFFHLSVLATQPSAYLARKATFFFLAGKFMKVNDHLQAPAALLPSEQPSVPIEYGRALEPNFMSWWQTKLLLLLGTENQFVSLSQLRYLWIVWSYNWRIPGRI